jgi:maltooligosyltrehalose trehalohydrolase
VTVVEMMPIAEFPGRFGWGYDGVDLFAPSHLYGTPDDLRGFVDAAHGAGVSVILDVVYNHLGPDGNYLAQFSGTYFTDAYVTDWGEAINFHGPDSAPVREFFTENAAYWIRELHFDGLRLDATQNIYDRAPDPVHIVAEVARSARAAGGGRQVLVVAENEPQDANLVRPAESGGQGLDALWNDDFHHTAHVALTGHTEAYFTDYGGSPQELVSAAKWGFLFQGQYYRWQQQRRGTPALDLPSAAFIHFIQNHDQVANSATGERIHRLTAPGRLRAITAVTLLGPATPMLFQGQEFAASAPFLYFADHAEQLARTVHRGRREFMAQFPSAALPEIQAAIPDPADPATFERCRLDFAERERHAEAYALHRDLLRLRREDGVFRAQRGDRMHGAVLGAEAFLLRFIGDGGDDRLLLVNLGADLHPDPAPEPLLAPPARRAWRLLWSSEDPRYGGAGTPAPERDGDWRIPGPAALVMTVMEEEAREEGSDGDG